MSLPHDLGDRYVPVPTSPTDTYTSADTAPIQPWTPPTLQELLDRAGECYRHESFGSDDLEILLREAYEAGAMGYRPFVSISPGMRSGRPTVNHTRLSVEAVTDYVWAGYTPDEVAEEYDTTRESVLVACWYAGKYGSKRWRRRWSEWADSVHGELWHHRYDVPDPPDEKGE